MLGHQRWSIHACRKQSTDTAGNLGWLCARCHARRPVKPATHRRRSFGETPGFVRSFLAPFVGAVLPKQILDIGSVSRRGPPSASRDQRSLLGTWLQLAAACRLRLGDNRVLPRCAVIARGIESNALSASDGGANKNTRWSSLFAEPLIVRYSKAAPEPPGPGDTSLVQCARLSRRVTRACCSSSPFVREVEDRGAVPRLSDGEFADGDQWVNVYRTTSIPKA